MSESYKDTEIIEGLREEKLWAFEAVYQSSFKMVRNNILKNSGTEEDARDVFQDMFIILIDKIRSKTLHLTPQSKLSTFVFGITRNLWLNRIRKAGKLTIVNQEDNTVDYVAEDEFELLQKRIDEDRFELIEKAFLTMGEECRKIIEMFYYQKMKTKDIATLLSYTEGFIRIKKMRCMKELKKKIINR